MKPELSFKTVKILRSELGNPDSVPDLGSTEIMQNDLVFRLSEEDEIFEGYGRLASAYPYRQQSDYSRKLQEIDTEVAMLENDYLKAVFLPEFGGRLWSLVKKETGENLLYTNDVIRFSNLAVRNAWFSGGVEWNIGVIGHSPLTNEPLFTAQLEYGQGIPVLRMYGYERIREVEYQMDFWMEEGEEALNCRMRIVNSSKEVVPMYWWSNMAVPEFDGGRVIVPAKEAFTSVDKEVYKTSVPWVGNVDISHYERIPDQIDYFFDIPEESPKYIVNLDKNGRGLLQISTKRLRSRKLFSWGHNKGSDRWQEFLTENAGRYVEIQAGLGKTQYGCIPMPPHTAWEWLEQYRGIQVSAPDASFEELQREVDRRLKEERLPDVLEKRLKESKQMAFKQAEVLKKGTEHAALKQIEREITGDRPLSEHLDYGTCTKEYSKVWEQLLRKGRFVERSYNEIPEDFQCSPVFYQALKCAADQEERRNWYVHYQLGLMHWFYGKRAEAYSEFEKSQELLGNPWSCHALAVLNSDRKEKALHYIRQGLSMRDEDLSYVKEMFRILLVIGAAEEILDIYEELKESIRENSRIRYIYMKALSLTGQCRKGYEMLMEDPQYVMEDIRECEDSIGNLYCMLYKGVFGKEPDVIPQQWDFHAL